MRQPDVQLHGLILVKSMYVITTSSSSKQWQSPMNVLITHIFVHAPYILPWTSVAGAAMDRISWVPQVTSIYTDLDLVEAILYLEKNQSTFIRRVFSLRLSLQKNGSDSGWERVRRGCYQPLTFITRCSCYQLYSDRGLSRFSFQCNVRDCFQN